MSQPESLYTRRLQRLYKYKAQTRALPKVSTELTLTRDCAHDDPACMRTHNQNIRESHTRLCADHKPGTTPTPGELFCWDFFEMYYKIRGSSAKLDQ